MVIKFKCSGCGKGYKIRDDQAGSQIECPECDTLMKVPRPSLGSPTDATAQATPAGSQQKKTLSPGSIVVKSRKSSKGGNRKPLLIGAGISVAVLLMGGLAFLLFSGEEAEQAAVENVEPAANVAVAAAPAPEVEAVAPAVDLIAAAPENPPEPQKSVGIAPVVEKAVPGFTRYTGGQEEIKLPGVITDLVAGGRGRYLVIYLKAQRQILIYDANEVKIV
ncbi:MAG: hypothetical protein KDA74_07265, partial [Planctomycetaceae bacterium]|nr:hypothetical protein [Planctomycetaceae bacterium]